MAVAAQGDEKAMKKLVKQLQEMAGNKTFQASGNSAEAFLARFGGGI